MHVCRLSVAKYPASAAIHIHSNREITIRILSVSVRIAGIRISWILFVLSYHCTYFHRVNMSLCKVTVLFTC